MSTRTKVDSVLARIRDHDDVIADTTDAIEIDELPVTDEGSDPFAADEPAFGPGVAARSRLVADLDQMTTFGMQLAAERCWQDGTTEPHLVLADVLGTAASLGVAIVDPCRLYGHPELGPWLRDEWPDQVDDIDRIAASDHAAWKAFGFSPSEKGGVGTEWCHRRRGRRDPARCRRHSGLRDRLPPTVGDGE